MKPVPAAGMVVEPAEMPLRNGGLDFLNFNATAITPLLEATLDAWFRLDGRARIILHRDGAIAASIYGLEQLIEQIDCVQMAHGRLRIETHDAAISLRHLLRVSGDETATMLVRCRRQDKHCIFRATAIADDLVCIAFNCTGPRALPRLADLRTAFGLTDSEANVVELLLEGLGVPHVAAHQGISPHTVRAHIRRIYDKLGVSTREELWQTLIVYRTN